MTGGSASGPLRTLAIAVAAAAIAFTGPPGALAQGAAAPGKELSGRAKARDANGNGVIDRDEAGGPLKASFDAIDCDRSGTLDGAEIRGFFGGEGCPKGAAPAAGDTKEAQKSGAAKPGAPGGGAPARAVRVDRVIEEPLSQTYPVIGRLVARRAGDVAARINGAVAEIAVTVGDRVKKGDLIARLAQDRLAAERDKYAAALRTAKAMVSTAEAERDKTRQELKRAEGLRSSAAFSRAKYEDLVRDLEARKASLAERHSQVREAEAELQRAEIDLANAEIRAPYAGVITEKHTEVGAYVNVGARVVSMINDDDIEIEAEVPTDRVAGLQPGRRVAVRLDDGTEHRATVRAVVPQENLRTRTRTVRFAPAFGATGKPLAVNQSVTVQVPVGRPRTVATVSKDAIVRRADGAVVYVVRGGRAFPRRVELGQAVGSRYVVVSGLEPGDVTVTYGNETLPPGAPVEIRRDRPPGAARPVGQ